MAKAVIKTKTEKEHEARRKAQETRNRGMTTEMKEGCLESICNITDPEFKMDTKSLKKIWEKYGADYAYDIMTLANLNPQRTMETTLRDNEQILQHDLVKQEQLSDYDLGNMTGNQIDAIKDEIHQNVSQYNLIVQEYISDWSKRKLTEKEKIEATNKVLQLYASGLVPLDTMDNMIAEYKVKSSTKSAMQADSEVHQSSKYNLAQTPESQKRQKSLTARTASMGARPQDKSNSKGATRTQPVPVRSNGGAGME